VFPGFTVRFQLLKLKLYPCTNHCRGCDEDCRGLALEIFVAYIRFV
jgi:hypothetical protein